MIGIKIRVSSASVERFIDPEHAVNLSIIGVHTTLNFVKVQQVNEKMLKISFRVIVSYDPTLAHANIKGDALIKGSKQEVTELYSNYQNKKPLPPFIVKRVLECVVPDLIILTRMIGLPSPVPLDPLIQTKTSKINYAI